MPSSRFSDPTGMFEVMLFPEVLAAARPLLEAGKSLLITASADWDGDELKLRALSITDLDQPRPPSGRGPGGPADDAAPLGAIAAQLKPARQGHRHLRGAGRASGEEVEIALPKRHAVTRRAERRDPVAAGRGMTVEVASETDMYKFAHRARRIRSQAFVLSLASWSCAKQMRIYEIVRADRLGAEGRARRDAHLALRTRSCAKPRLSFSPSTCRKP